MQGCFLTEKEIERVVDFIRLDEEPDENKIYNKEIIEEIDRRSFKSDKKSNGNQEDFDKKDSMLFAAIETVVENKQASTSFLQRKLKLGYARAARIMDELENMKIVGPQIGSKPREIYMTKEQFLQMNLNEEK